jgi:hypothetical protein
MLLLYLEPTASESIVTIFSENIFKFSTGTPYRTCSKIVFIFNFVKFIATKKVKKLIYFSPLLFIVVGSGSGMEKKPDWGKNHLGSATLIAATVPSSA